MAKQKVSKRAVNKYPHNLSKFTIVTDANSFEARGVRYLVYRAPTLDVEDYFERSDKWDNPRDVFLHWHKRPCKSIDGIIINIETGQRYPINLKKYLLYI